PAAAGESIDHEAAADQIARVHRGRSVGHYGAKRILEPFIHCSSEVCASARTSRLCLLEQGSRLVSRGIEWPEVPARHDGSCRVARYEGEHPIALRIDEEGGCSRREADLLLTASVRHPVSVFHGDEPPAVAFVLDADDVEDDLLAVLDASARIPHIAQEPPCK